MSIALAILNRKRVIGSIDPASGCPIIEIEISGPFSKPQKFTAMVDTGFSGFVSLPILKAFPLGLVLKGTLNITLADGSSHARLTCIGMVQFDGKKEVGLVLIEWQNTEILVGMEFLSIFGKQLTVDAANKKVEIVDAPAPPTPPTPAVAPAAPTPPGAPNPLP